MSAEEHSNTPQKRRPNSTTIVLLAVVIFAAGGLYAWNTYIRTIGSEILVEPEMLFAGAADTAIVSAYGVNSQGGRAPFSGVKIRAEILEGTSLGRIEQAGDAVRFISHGMAEGEVLLLIHIEGWPLPSQVTIRISAPLAAFHSHPQAHQIHQQRSTT